MVYTRLVYQLSQTALHNQSQTRTTLHSSFCKVYWCYCQHFNTIIYKPSSAAWLKTQSAARSKLSSVLDKAFLACLAVKPIACNISTFSGDTALKQSNVKISLQYYSNYQTCLLILIECRYDSMGFFESLKPTFRLEVILGQPLFLAAILYPF